MKNLRSKRLLRVLAVVLGFIVLYLMFPPPHTDILVLGVDSRSGEGWTTRADSIMLVGVDPASLRVAMMSIPRDLSLTVPDYGLQRVNTINMLGEMEAAGSGPALTQAAIAASFGIQPDRYVRLNFEGFVALVDAVGGISVDVERHLIDYNYPTADYGVMTVEFEAGRQHMNGERALIYARTRYADDDFQRTRRQQQVVSALLGKLIVPIYWPSALIALNQTLDTDLTLWDMLTLAPPIVLGGAGGERLTIDRERITATAEGVVIPDYPQLETWVSANFD